MDKEKQIEEMAKELNYKCKSSCYDNNCNTRCGTFKVCEIFYDLVYRKINDNEIVISKEEYKALTSQRYKFKNGKIELIPSAVEIRKETAKKFVNMIYWKAVKHIKGKNNDECFIEISFEKLDEIAKQFGVDLGEEYGKRKSERD